MKETRTRPREKRPLARHEIRRTRHVGVSHPPVLAHAAPPNITLVLRGDAHASKYGHFGSASRRVLQECIEAADSAFLQKRFATALEFYQQALRFGVDPSQHAYERWMCLMQLGLFEAAWQETDRTERQRRTTHELTDDLPRHLRRVWDGRPLAGKTVLLRCNHGLGDTIQFCRYLEPLSRVAQDLFVEAQPQLVPLLQTMTTSRPLTFNPKLDQEHFDAEVELMELPYFFRTSLETIPADIPYLQVPQNLLPSRFNELSSLGLTRDKFNVGVVWSSGEWNHERDIALHELGVLGAIPGVQLFSLQRGSAALQLEQSGLLSSIAQTERDAGTPLDTAGAILHLDLIISVDTMVAHLAGALGKPTWTLLPYHADWRWMADREDTPWYPTMRLFRQSRPGDWCQPMERVRCELVRLASWGREAHQTSSGSISSV